MIPTVTSTPTSCEPIGITKYKENIQSNEISPLYLQSYQLHKIESSLLAVHLQLFGIHGALASNGSESSVNC